MDNTRLRVRQACDRCRHKKIKCNGEHACDRCADEDAICSYNSDRRQDSSALTSVEMQNRQMKEAIHRLYSCVRNGYSLPALSVHNVRLGRPLVHDIVAYVNSMPSEAFAVDAKKTQDISTPNMYFGGLSEMAQAEPWVNSSSSTSAPGTANSTSQRELPNLENDIGLDDLWSLVDVNNPEAAALYNFVEAHRM